jgi:hypothetical protein
VYFTELMMITYRKSALLFDPVPVARRCETNDDCEEDEECIKGVCTPIAELPLAELSWFGQRCQTNDECEQDEECIMGRCVPIVGGGLDPGALATGPIYDDRLSKALEAYLHRLQNVMFKSLVIDPRTLPQVRHHLMEFYAAAAKIAGKKLTPCDGPAGCPDGSACVNGVCVPVPFRLVFKPSFPRP